MRILKKKDYLLIASIGLTFGITKAQNNPISNTTDSIVDNFITQKIVLEKEKAVVNINQDPRIPRLLDLKSKMDKDGKFSDRYKIQLYNGSLLEANKIKTKADDAFPQWRTDIKWETPNHKVWIGNYRTRLEAERALKEIKKVFSEAFSFRPRNGK